MKEKEENENIEINNNYNDEIKDENEENKNIIKHIVISGGGITGFSFYGLLRESSIKGLWNIDNIQSIYSTSVGAIFGTVIALKYDWDTLDDYLIKRPWNSVYHFDMQKLFLVYQTKGIFDKKVIEESFLPLFKGKDISIDITMKDFYEISNIELHLYTTNINDFEKVDISYKSHPDWKLIDAIYSSCSLPILFQPLIKENIWYCDGGIFADYPIKDCIDNGANENEILGICRKSNLNINNYLTSDSSLIDYLMNIFYKITNILLKSRCDYIKIKNEYAVNSNPISIYQIYLGTSNIDERLRLIQIGVDEFNSNKKIE